MPRSMLQLRMQALEAQLEKAQDPSTWKDSLLVLQNFVVDDDLWSIAIEKIHEQAMDQLDCIQLTMKHLSEGRCDEQQAWKQYNDVQAKSEEIFRECLELLGGLALRDRLHDNYVYVCQYADEFLKELARHSRLKHWFSIPALDHTVSSALRRVASVRFPEWHLWTLPLVAHEYAHVVIEETARMQEFIGQVVDDMSDTAKSGATTPVGEKSQVKRKALVLLADALATYTTGPAYACAALILRLSPLTCGTEERPSDEERAAMILGLLGSMGPAKRSAFRDMAATLQQYWQRSVSAARGMADTAENALDMTPPIPPEKVIREFERWFFRPGSTYTIDDWAVAKKWSAAWVQEIKDESAELGVPAVTERRRLRDALNACWHCRVEVAMPYEPEQAEEAEEQVKKIADVGQQLCQNIIIFDTSAAGLGEVTQPAQR